MAINDKLITQILEATLRRSQNIDNLQKIEPKVEVKEMRVPFYKHLVMLVDVGFLNYVKMTPENYYYWWYEVDSRKMKPNKNIFTADLSAFKITRKGQAIYKLKHLDYYKDSKYSELLVEHDRLFECSREELVEILTYKMPDSQNQMSFCF